MFSERGIYYLLKTASKSGFWPEIIDEFCKPKGEILPTESDSRLLSQSQNMFNILKNINGIWALPISNGEALERLSKEIGKIEDIIQFVEAINA